MLNTSRSDVVDKDVQRENSLHPFTHPYPIVNCQRQSQ